MEPIQYLYRALRSPLGIIVKTDDPQRLRADLIAAKKAAGDVDLFALAIRWSPRGQDEIWITKSKD